MPGRSPGDERAEHCAIRLSNRWRAREKELLINIWSVPLSLILFTLTNTPQLPRLPLSFILYQSTHPLPMETGNTTVNHPSVFTIKYCNPILISLQDSQRKEGSRLRSRSSDVRISTRDGG